MPRPRKISQSEYETLASFRFALRQFLRFSEQAAQLAGLTPQQHQAMLAIKGFPGGNRVTIGELASRLHVVHHSAVGLVDRLVTEKLACREASTEDRRQVFVRLTPQGEKLLDELSFVHREELQRTGPALRDLLDRLLEGRPVTFN